MSSSNNGTKHLTISVDNIKSAIETFLRQTKVISDREDVVEMAFPYSTNMAELVSHRDVPMKLTVKKEGSVTRYT